MCVCVGGALHFRQGCKEEEKSVKFRITSYMHFEFSKFHMKFLLINLFIDVNFLNWSWQGTKEILFFSIILKS